VLNFGVGGGSTWEGSQNPKRAFVLVAGMVVVAAGRRLTEPQKRAVMLAFWVKRTVEAAATSKKCSFSGLGGWWINQLDVEYNFK